MSRAYLVVLVEPEEGEVGDADGLPVVRDLLARAVDDVRHLIGHDEFKVLNALSKDFSYLGGELVSDEEPVFDLDGADHVVVEDLLLLLLRLHVARLLGL